MKITEVKNLYKYLIGAIPIGIGTTAVCFLLPNKKILKVYYDNLLKGIMMTKLDILDKIGNDSYIAPEEVLIKENKCIAQIYEYVDAKTLHNISSCFLISDILKNYDKLVSDTRGISSKLFVLGDLHDKNILFNGLFHVIDLDKGYVSEKLTEDATFEINMRKINEVILYSLFKIKCYETIDFYDFDIQTLYSHSLSNPDNFQILLEKFKSDTDDINVKKLSKKIKYSKSINTYYKF